MSDTQQRHKHPHLLLNIVIIVLETFFLNLCFLISWAENGFLEIISSSTAEPKIRFKKILNSIYNETWTSLNVFFANPTFNIFPNPSSEFIYIKSNFKFNLIEIYNLLGEKVKNLNVPSLNNFCLDVSNCANGLYFVKVINKTSTDIPPFYFKFLLPFCLSINKFPVLIRTSSNVNRYSLISLIL